MTKLSKEETFIRLAILESLITRGRGYDAAGGLTFERWAPGDGRARYRVEEAATGRNPLGNSWDSLRGLGESLSVAISALDEQRRLDLEAKKPDPGQFTAHCLECGQIGKPYANGQMKQAEAEMHSRQRGGHRVIVGVEVVQNQR